MQTYQQQGNAVPQALIWIIGIGAAGLLALAFIFKGHVAF